MRTKNAMTNLIAALLLSIVTAVSGLILPRLFITTYGSEINGLISSIKQFLVYLSLVEAGIGYASMAMLYLPIKEKDYRSTNAILSATKIHYVKSGWIFLALVLVLAVVYPFFVIGEVPWIMSYLMILVLGVSGVSEFFLIGKYRIFLTAAQKGYVVSFIQTGGLVLNIGVSVILIRLSVEPVVVQLVSSLFYVSRFIFLKVYIRSKFQQVNYNEKPDHNALDKRWDVLVHQIVSLVLSNTPIIIITFFCGLKEVSVFTVYLLVHNMVVMLLSIFMNGFQAIFGDIISEKNKGILQKSYHLYECLFYAIVMITYVVVALLYMPFESLYTAGMSDTNYIRPQIALLFVFIGLLHNLRLPPMSIMNSAGIFKDTKASAIVEAVISLVLSLILVQFWGMEGVLIGWLIAYIYRIIVLIKQISGDFVYGSINITVKVIVLNAMFGAAAYVVNKRFIVYDINNFMDFLLNGVLISIVTTLIIMLLNLIIYRREFLLIKEKVIRVFK